VVLGDVVADRSGNHFSRSIASLAARSARIAVATDDDAGVQVRATVAVERPPAPCPTPFALNGCNPDFLNVDLTASRKFGDWEFGLVASGPPISIRLLMAT